MGFRVNIARINWILSSQFGINVYRFFSSLRGLLPFIRDWLRFRKLYHGEIRLMPCLHDRYEEGGLTKNEYFWQDLHVARWIHAAKPERHVDVGSRIDGFVAHVASFRDLEVFDIRPVTTTMPGVLFKQADLMQSLDVETFEINDYCDSLSCLHALEHFGLGRYGDTIDQQGYALGIKNMASLLRQDGFFYLSTPIGKERVEFNAHRVFNPQTIIQCAAANKLQLQKLYVINSDGNVNQVNINDSNLHELSLAHYNLGIFIFIKNRT